MKPLQSNEWAEVNLKKEAEARGVDPGRLIFADSCSYSEFSLVTGYGLPNSFEVKDEGNSYKCSTQC